MITYELLKTAIEKAEKIGVNYVELQLNNTTCKVNLTLANQWLNDLI